MSRLRAEIPAEELMQVEEVDHFLDDDTRLGDIMRGERATLGLRVASGSGRSGGSGNGTNP